MLNFFKRINQIIIKSGNRQKKVRSTVSCMTVNRDFFFLAKVGQIFSNYVGMVDFGFLYITFSCVRLIKTGAVAGSYSP